MARITDNSLGENSSQESGESITKIDALGQDSITISDSSFIADSVITRDGQDLSLENSNGDTTIIENYFLNDEAPLIESSDGSVLTPNLVQSFLSPSPEYAQAGTLNDVSPVGAVEELNGEAFVLRTDGTKEEITLGTPIYQGDTIETSANGAVNILFLDETSMAVSEDARLSIDNYEFDPTTESGETNLSVLRGVFVYTSGLIGRDDPDDVMIDTPVGSIGIRGTIIAGKIQPGAESEITVVEGAIVVKNGMGETTLSQQYESVKISGFDQEIEGVGVKSPNDVSDTYGSVSDVVPKLFSSINDNIKTQESQEKNAEQTEENAEDIIEVQEDATEEEIALEEENPTEENLDLLPDNPFETILQENKGEELDKKDLLDRQERKNIKGRTLHNGQNDDQLNPTLFEDDKLQIRSSRSQLFEGSQDGDVIGKLFVDGGNDGSKVFTFANGTNTSQDGNFELVQINGRAVEIRLTSIGESAVGAGTVGSTAGSEFHIIVSDSSGQVKSISVTPTILDAAVNLNQTGGLNYDVANAPASGPQKAGDFNGDGVQEHLIVNSTANTLNLINGTDNTSLNMESAVLGINHNTVDGVGDVNNDGFDDFAYGAPDAGTGFVNLVHGNNSGDYTPDQISNGGASGDSYGHAVSGIGDFDGDGRLDYAVSALNANAGGPNRGEIYIKFGDGGTDTTVFGHVDNMNLGNHIDGLGDINGDGLSDIIVSAQGTVGGNYEAYIINGGSAPSTSAGASTKISTPHEIVAGGGAGDINGDGFDDIAISLQMGNDVNTFVIFGNNTPLPSTIDMTYLENPDNALKIHHAGAGVNGDYQITALDDVNGDGFDDIQIGTVDGQQYVVHGDIAGNAPYALDGTATDGAGAVGAPDGVISATANDQALVGDVDFYDNMQSGLSMKGGGSDNTFYLISNTGGDVNFMNIDGGKGHDTIQVSTNLDFSNVNYEQISQIESIDLGASSTVTLTAENIFNLLKTSDNGELFIDGSSGAQLQLATGTLDPSVNSSELAAILNTEGSGASVESDKMIDGETYQHFEIGGYDLYIDMDVTVQSVV